ncbi:MAG TPA: NPCBM/NEW2 domain-containing protein [Capsulimonadaceae bacterium]|jgi:alpha-galactosidase
MKLPVLFATALAAIAFCPASPAQAETPPGSVWIESLNLSMADQEYASPRPKRSVDNAPLTIKKTVFEHGIGSHAAFVMLIDLHGEATRFTARVGVDDEACSSGSVAFAVDIDGKRVLSTPVMRVGDEAKSVNVDLTGAKTLRLVATDGGDGITCDHADWGDAQITMAPDAKLRPVALPAVSVPNDPPRMTVPPVTPLPGIHGPKAVGATPGRPFLFLVPATGDAPLTYGAIGLPAGVALDPRTGIISGSIKAVGTTVATITVKNAAGATKRKLTFVSGDHKLAQTPPMGWNSWNVWAGNISDAKVRDAADAMITSGLAAHGYQYVNIDDCWEAGRDEAGKIQSNSKFPNMTSLADYVHQRGLKIGLYSSPGPKTCGGFEGSYQHEAQDAASYADWGFDYLKYDWCSYGGIVKGDNSLEAKQKPYAVMGEALSKVSRDILFSFCQYGMGNVASWGASLGGNCWRTTGDITDTWRSMHGIYEAQNGLEKYAGPGHWNDPDMLVVGQVGWGSPHPSKLTQNEQIVHMTMWSLLASPLLIGCDMKKLDEFTLAVLTNDEVLDINQDPLGRAAGKLASTSMVEVWWRPLSDGTVAVGLINTGTESSKGSVLLSEIGLNGTQPARDLWLHKDLGMITGSYSVDVPAHGAVLIKVGKSSGS